MYPLHILMFLAALAFLLVTSQLDKNLIFAKAISNVLLIQGLIPISSFYYSFNGVSWYLSLTLFLYILYPYAKKIIEKKNPILMVTLLFVAMFIICFLITFTPCTDDIEKWFVYINPFARCLDFLIGGCAGLIIKDYSISNKSRNCFSILFIFLTAISILVFWKLKTNEDYTWLIYSVIYVPGVFFGLLSLGTDEGVLSKVFSLKPLVMLGNISGYAFLIHQMAIWYSGSVCGLLGLPGIAKIVLAFVGTIVASILYDKVVRVADKNYLAKGI